MSVVRFAMLCDHCGSRSCEYTPWLTCRECGEEVCNSCIVPDSADDESGKATCLRCNEDTKVQAKTERESAILSLCQPFAWACTRTADLFNPLAAAIRESKS